MNNTVVNLELGNATVDFLNNNENNNFNNIINNFKNLVKMKKNQFFKKMTLTVAMIALSGAMFNLLAQTPVCEGDTYEIAVKITNASTIDAEWVNGNAGTGNVPQPQFDQDEEVWVWTYATKPQDAGKVIKVRFSTNATGEYCEGEGEASEVFEFTVHPKSLATQIAVTGNEAAICSGQTAELAANIVGNDINNPVFNWYAAIDAAEPLHTGATYETEQLYATTTYYVSVEGSNYCEGEADANGRKAVTVTVYDKTIATQIAVTGDENAICSGTTAELAASIVGNDINDPVFHWYSAIDAAEPFYTGATYETDQLYATTTYYVSVEGSNYCEGEADVNGRKAVTVTVNDRPDAPTLTVAAEDLFICQEEKITPAFLIDFVESDYDIEFYTDANCSQPLTSITALLSEGSYTIYAISKDSQTTCSTDPSNKLTIKIDVHPCTCDTPAEIQIIRQGVKH